MFIYKRTNRILYAAVVVKMFSLLETPVTQYFTTFSVINVFFAFMRARERETVQSVPSDFYGEKIDYNG